MVVVLFARAIKSPNKILAYCRPLPSKEFGFFDGFGECNVFGFHGGKCDSRLFVGLPGNGTVSEEEDVARGRFTVVGVCCKTCIRESEK